MLQHQTLDIADPGRKFLFLNQLIQSLKENGLQDFIHVFHENMQPIMPCAWVGLAIFQPESHQVRFIAEGPSALDVLDKECDLHRECPLSRIIHAGKLQKLEELSSRRQKESLCAHFQAILAAGKQACIVLPLALARRPVGAFVIASDEQGFCGREQEMFLHDVSGALSLIANEAFILNNHAETREWMDHILQNTSDGVIILDNNDRIMSWNKGAENIFGASVQEVMHQSFAMFIPDDMDSQKELALIRRHVEEHQVLSNYHAKRVRKDGRVIYVDITSSCLKDINGHIEGRYSIVRDITEQELAQLSLYREQARVKAIIETAVDGIITITEEGIVQTFNPAAEKLFKYRAEEIIGQNISILMPSPFSQEHDDYIRRFLDTGMKKIIGVGREAEGRRKDGTTFPCFLAVSEMNLEGEIMFTGIIRDLSDIREAQQEAMNAKTLAEIGQMCASIAHEIKNPLAGISGVIQVLRDGMDTDASRRGVLTEVLEQIKRLDHSVHDLLFLAKPKHPELRLRSLRDIIHEVKQAAMEFDEFSNVQFYVDPDVDAVVPVDAEMFEQVLWNLFHNAAHSMPEGGTIRCSIEKTQEKVMVKITDTGNGITHDILSRVFDPFFTTKTRGTGLGLSNCKKIMEAHQGSMSITSRPNHGTLVTLILPRGNTS